MRNVDKTKESARHQFLWLQSQGGVSSELLNMEKHFLTKSAGKSIFSKTLFEFKLCSFCLKWLSCSNSNQASSTLEILEREKNYLNHILRLSRKQNILAKFQVQLKTSLFLRKTFVSPDMLLVTGCTRTSGEIKRILLS